MGTSSRNAKRLSGIPYESCPLGCVFVIFYTEGIYCFTLQKHHPFFHLTSLFIWVENNNDGDNLFSSHRPFFVDTRATSGCT